MLTAEQKAQRKSALARANAVRSARAEIKRQLGAGETTLETLLYDSPEALLSASIGDVLEWVPGVGEFRAKRILGGGIGSPGVGWKVAVGCLSDSTKARLVARAEAHVSPQFVRQLVA